ncbi:hypothetical protein [Nonomuraea sp. NPDC005501]|uniref:hypothetical protein n=1 Tax=Nonomuraea sp. NPDC005501 TaxID=3156884 RepID=UPI0033A0EAA5
MTTKAPIMLIHGLWVTPPSWERFAGRSHLLIAEDGWQDVADHALDWVRHACRT